MSFLSSRASKFAIGGIAVAGAFYGVGALSSRNVPMLSTPGVQNIERAYTAGGGSPTGQPAQGTRERRKLRDAHLSGETADLDRSFMSKKLERGGDDQRPGEPGIVSQKFNEMKYGTKNDK